MTTGRPRRRLAFWLALGALLLVARLGWPLRPAVTHDAFQYLNAAEHAGAGRLGRTSLVHFDAERSFGVVPAPLVTFPMGFPLAMAAAGVSGIPYAAAGALVSGLAFLVTLGLVWLLAARVGLAGRARDAAMLLTATSGALLQFAGTISTELLFTAVITAGFTLLAGARRAPVRLGAWALAGLLLGASYHVRYAGLFLVAGFGPVTAWYMVIARDRRRATGAFIAGAVATGIVLIGFARNIALVGNWRGGNEKVVSHPLGEVAVESVRAAHGLLLGPGWGPLGTSMAARALFIGAVLAGTAWLVVRAWRASAASGADDSAVDTGALRDLSLLVAVYCAGMVYAALTSVISYGTRMFVPLVPVLAVLAVGSLHALARRVSEEDRRLAGRGAVALIAASVLINLTALWRPPVDRLSVVEAQLSATNLDGRSVRDVLHELLGTDGVLLANNGQAVGYALDRPTISLVGPRYSVVTWDEAAVRDAVQRFGVSAVAITAPGESQPDEPDLIPSPFVRALADGNAPAWLRPLGRVGRMQLYVPAIRPLSP